MKPHPDDCSGEVQELHDTQTSLPWGDDIDRDLAWCPECGWKSQRTRTTPSLS